MRTIHLKIVWLIAFWGCFTCCIQSASAKDFVVVIDAGHGGHDAGAVGKISKEKNINLKVALAVGKLIESSDPSIKVYYTRKRDVFVTLQGRAQIANKHKADLFISIHTNALPKGKIVRGTETYTLGLHRTQENLDVAKKENSVILIENDYETHYAGFNPNSSESYIMFEFMQDKNMKQSVQLATLVQKQFKNSAHRIDRGVRQAGFLVLHATSMPSILIELGYISTPDEEKYLNSQAGVQAMSYSISKAILSYKASQVGTNAPNKPANEPKQLMNDIETPDIQPEDSDLQRRENNRPVAQAEKPIRTGSTTPEENTKRNVSTSPDKNKKENKNTQTSKPVFKIQILTSSTILKNNDRKLKGFSPVNYYKENGIYKYTYGESTNYNEILRMKRKVDASFKDAFIIAFKNGKKMNVHEAIQEFKRNR